MKRRLRGPATTAMSCSLHERSTRRRDRWRITQTLIRPTPGSAFWRNEGVPSKAGAMRRWKSGLDALDGWRFVMRIVAARARVPNKPGLYCNRLRRIGFFLSARGDFSIRMIALSRFSRGDERRALTFRPRKFVEQAQSPSSLWTGQPTPECPTGSILGLHLLQTSGMIRHHLKLCSDLTTVRCSRRSRCIEAGGCGLRVPSRRAAAG